MDDMLEPFEIVGAPPDSFFVVLALAVAAAFLFFAVKKSRKAGYESLKRPRQR